jgi:hypothetical protein
MEMEKYCNAPEWTDAPRLTDYEKACNRPYLKAHSFTQIVEQQSN